MSFPGSLSRDLMLEKLEARSRPWDMAIVGGGATGVGTALDAAARGYDVVLFEQADFGQGTSSRSTKLVHGGVRYLQQGNVALVMESLRERGILRANAPHLVSELAFVVPNYDWWEAPFYGVGMKVYDMLAGKYGFGESKILTRDEVLERIPTLERGGLRGGVLYHDGQFDDARLLVNLVQSAARQGALLLNRARATNLSKDASGFIDGLEIEDVEGGTRRAVPARVVINATGPFSDAIRRLDDPGCSSMIAPSQGVHLVLDGSFLPSGTAIMVPRTSDKRVMFAIPWHGHALVGTTDTPISTIELEPRPLEEEIDFILETAAPYLEKDPTREDVLSAFAGIRPLVKAEEASSTAALSREHTIAVSNSGLLTIAGGKWTTYRKMAEHCVEHAATLARLDERPCPTRTLRLHGACESPADLDALAVYGSDASRMRALIEAEPELGARLHEALPIVEAQVTWAARHEMARSVDDVLSRRTRALPLNAAAARAMAPRVARILARELGRDASWQREQVTAFDALATTYEV